MYSIIGFEFYTSMRVVFIFIGVYYSTVYKVLGFEIIQVGFSIFFIRDGFGLA